MDVGPHGLALTAVVLAFVLATVVVTAWLVAAVDPRAPMVLVPVLEAVRRLLRPLVGKGSFGEEPPEASP